MSSKGSLISSDDRRQEKNKRVTSSLFITYYTADAIKLDSSEIPFGVFFKSKL